MKLNIKSFAIAQAVAAAILFAVCSFLVGFFPEAAVSVGRYALHTDFSTIMRPLSVSGFIVGLLGVSLGWGVLSLVTANIYNSMTKNTA